MRFLARATLLGGLLTVMAVMAVMADGSRAGADDNKVDLIVGQPAPVFEAVDDQGKPWKSSDHVGKKYIVVYFYPGDFTPGCTAQAQTFRNSMNYLTEKGIEVVRVSGDSVQTHALFKQAQKLNFTLLADEDGGLAKRFGVPIGAGSTVKTKGADGKLIELKRGVTAQRWTFIIGMDCKIVYKNTKVNPVEDSKQVAAFIEKLEKK
jgi:peroxiredoxin Q/BCP